MRSRWVAAAVLFLGLAGCRNERIETYRVPKESSVRAEPVVSSDRIRWSIPAGWKEQPASGMRVGSFRIEGGKGYAADFSVIPLSGEAGGDLPNINRWRGQIQLSALTESNWRQQVQTVQFAGHSMIWVDFSSEQPLLDNKHPLRVTAAIYKEGETTWFFKMAGEDETVKAAQPAFRRFLSSLEFAGHGH